MAINRSNPSVKLLKTILQREEVEIRLEAELRATREILEMLQQNQNLRTSVALATLEARKVSWLITLLKEWPGRTLLRDPRLNYSLLKPGEIQRLAAIFPGSQSCEPHQELGSSV